MILSDHSLYQARWGRPLLIAGGLHAAAVGALFLHVTPPMEPSREVPAIAVEMASPASLPATVHDVPTPRQVEAPDRAPPQQPKPKDLPFDPPPVMQVADVKPEVVVPLRNEERPRPERVNPLPPAPTTTEQAAPDLRPSESTTAPLTGGVSAGRATAADLWDARVRARIEMTKRYPSLAANQSQEDSVNVLMTLDRRGRLLDTRVRGSRGFALLDAAALDAVRRAAPFPPPPDEIEGEQLRLSVIVRFYKRVR